MKVVEVSGSEMDIALRESMARGWTSVTEIETVHDGEMVRLRAKAGHAARYIYWVSTHEHEFHPLEPE